MGGVMKKITTAGGKAHVTVLDALDDAAVNQYIDGLAKQSGRIDVVFNATGPLVKEYGNGKLAVDLPIEEFMTPMTTVVKSQFITARAAARHMRQQRSGVIIFLTGSPARGHVEGATAIGTAFGAIESLTENLAVEVSPAGVRDVCLRTTGNTDSRRIQTTVDEFVSAANITKEQAPPGIANIDFLKGPAARSCEA